MSATSRQVRDVVAGTLGVALAFVIIAAVIGWLS